MRGNKRTMSSQQAKETKCKRLNDCVLPGFRRLTTIDRTLKEAKSNEI